VDDYYDSDDNLLADQLRELPKANEQYVWQRQDDVEVPTYTRDETSKQAINSQHNRALFQFSADHHQEIIIR
jgi:hypothetical protein